MKNTDNDLITISNQLEEYLKTSSKKDGIRVNRAKSLIVAILVYATDHTNNAYEAIGLLEDVKLEFNHLLYRKKLKQNQNLN